MESLEELQSRLQSIEAQIDEHRRKIHAKRKELYKLEDQLLETKEDALKVVNEIQEFRHSRDLSILIDTVREQEIQVFREKLPLLLRQLDEKDRKEK